MDKIGRYQIIKQIGQGGMGKVFLAFDPVCQRQIALKMIREELVEKPTFQTRFLKEVHITSHLTHPSIIPVYTIHKDKQIVYYTMPYIEGRSLQKILLESFKAEEEGDNQDLIGKSIHALIRLFLTLCEAIDYTHSKRVLHRDIKPDNIMVGKYGELLILDWGIAEKIDEQKPPRTPLPDKIAGTISYMAPERAMGKNASVKTEIYSLGVILYRLLTLRLPFRRKNLKHFRKLVEAERLIDPIEVAPYREIPQQLCVIVKKCLSKEDERYSNVGELISEIKNYIEGKPNWIFLLSLDITNKKDWQFQENVLLAKHIAITKQVDVSEWVSIMIAKASLSQNIKIEVEVKINEKGKGIGFLLSFPYLKKRRGLEEGYQLWISSAKNPSLQLYKSNVLIAEVPDVFSRNAWSKIAIEKIDDNLQVLVEGKPVLSYSSHLPLPGSRIGLLLKDEEFSIRNFSIFGKSHNVKVSCLAVPNAFLARKDYKTALEEYRKIGNSFPGRAEGREALFRAGLTILEKAKTTSDHKLYQKALSEFEKLYHTSGAPLEYLGKSMVYESLEDYEEEATCLEYCLRKFRTHPLISLLEEHIITRLHESSLQNREAAYRLALLSVLHLPKILENRDTKNLLLNLESHFEKLYFLSDQKEDNNTFMIIQLSFFLAREKILIELIRKTEDQKTLENALFSLLELGYVNVVKELCPEDNIVSIALKAYEESIEKAFEEYIEKNLDHQPLLYFLSRLCLDLEKPVLVIENLKNQSQNPLYVQALIFANQWDKVTDFFSSLSKEKLFEEGSYLGTIYGCFIAREKGEKKAKEYFSTALERPFPSYECLLGPFLLNQLTDEWENQAFFFEKKELYRQLALYSHCVNQDKEKKTYLKKCLESEN